MTSGLSPTIKKGMFDVMERYGYKSEKEFIEDALRRRILELRKIEFLAKAKKVRDKLTKKGLREEEILKDFAQFYHQK